MDFAERLDLIRSVRDELSKMDFEDVELLVEESGLGFLDWDEWRDNRRSAVGKIVRKADDNQLITLASYLSGRRGGDIETANPARSDGERAPLRLFASHQSDHKLVASGLAEAFAMYGITLFVAHEHIEPDQLWRAEILRELNAVDGGIAFLHDEFKTSDWCSQEVGWLLGRGVPVISLKYDIPPFGPLAERQAVATFGHDTGALVNSVLDVLAGRSELHGRLASSYVTGMARSFNFATTVRIWVRLRNLRNLDGPQCRDLLRALETNNQVYWAYSPDDGGRAYTDVVPEFLRSQPGIVEIQQALDEYVAGLALTAD